MVVNIRKWFILIDPGLKTLDVDGGASVPDVAALFHRDRHDVGTRQTPEAEEQGEEESVPRQKKGTLLVVDHFKMHEESAHLLQLSFFSFPFYP